MFLGGCGRTGERTQIPALFLLDSGQKKQKILAHEFFKLRFGIFDERGYLNDPVYPHFYLRNNKILPTRVTDEDVVGTWRDIDDRDTICYKNVTNCIFEPDPESNEDVKCSIGSDISSLANVTKYCDKVDLVPPTKHNNLCRGVTVQEILLASPDIKLVNEKSTKFQRPMNIDSFTPSIVTVQEMSPRYVLLVETSSSMSENDDWRWINKALQKLIRYDLSDAEIGLVTYTDVSDVEYNMTKLKDDRVRQHLADILPDRYRLHQSSARTSCLLCGVNSALELLGSQKQSGSIIIVTRGGQTSVREQRQLLEYADYYQIQMSSIVVQTASTDKDTHLYRQLADFTQGRCIIVSGHTPMVQRYRQISSGLSTIVNTKEIVLHEKVVDSDTSVTTGEILIDTAANINVTFAIFVAEAEDHFIKSVTLTKADTGAVYGPYNTISSLHDNINMKTVNYGLTPGSGSSLLTTGVWKYRVEWVQSSQRLQSVIVVTTLPSVNTDQYQVQVWTSSNSVVTVHHPLSLHVMVSRGYKPVLAANVTAIVTVNMPGVGTKVLTPIRLTDDGNGDVDTVANDGVYSRYLVEYPGPGIYSVSVLVDDNDNTAVVAGLDDYPPNNDCCGSTTNVNVENAMRTGAFARIITDAVSVDIKEVPKTSINDKMGPSRIGDLRVQKTSEIDKLRLVFTAPGDDFDHGKVKEFIIVYDKQMEKIHNGWNSQQILSRVECFNQSGEIVVLDVVWRHYLNDIFVGVIGVDDDINHGAMSNIIHVTKSSSAHVSNTEEHVAVVSDAATAVTENKVNDEWLLILALCCSFFLLSLCLFGGVFYFLKCAKPRKPVMVDIGVSDDVTDPDNVSHCSSEIRHMTSEFPLMLDVTGLVGGNYQASPAATPTYWSASQIMAEHEARSRPGTLTPIKEEYFGHFTEFGSSKNDYHDISGDGNNDYHEISDPGLSNLAYTSTPVKHPLPQPPVSNLAVMDSCSDSVDSGGGGGVLPEPEMFSMGVQTVAPSCIAAIRQSSDLVMINQHSKQSSLV